MNAGWSAMKALNVIIGLFSSLAVNMPDFGRWSKYENAGYSQFVFLPLLGTLGALAPIFVTSAAEYLWGEYIWFMPAVIANFDNRAAKVLNLRSKTNSSSSLALPWLLLRWVTRSLLALIPSVTIFLLSLLDLSIFVAQPSSWLFSALSLIVLSITT
jgi:cytosine/uracil/thiamine/allantoin permease